MAKRRLICNTLTHTRETIARIARDLYTGCPNLPATAECRLMLEALKEVGRLHKLGADLALADRLETIERAIAELQKK